MIDIRELNHNDDFEALIALSREFFREYESYHENFFEINELKAEDITDYFSKWIDDDNGETCIAISDNEIVGYITFYIKAQADYWMVKKIGEISGLMIGKSHRRKGIAEILFNESLEFFKKKNVRFFTLFTALENNDVLEFYKKQGMMPICITMMGEI